MKKVFIIFFVALLPVISMAQDAKNSQWGIKFSGFVKNDIFWDSRQQVAVREGHFYLYPKNEQLDENGNDINAKSSFNMLSIQTRLIGKITGPDAFGAKTMGYIEGEFFGHSNADINGFRLRHAFAKLNWTSTELMVGQYWHPMFITDCYPGTVSFNTGVPFIPFSRNPQIRVTQKFGDLKLKFSAVSQRDFVSTGPQGPSSIYLRNNVVPELNLTVQFDKKYEDGKAFVVGVGIDHKTLQPRLVTDNGYETDEKISGMSYIGYFKMQLKPITWKFQGTFGQETYNLIMLGGYAEEKILDEMKGIVSYTPINTMAFWTDIHTNGKKIQGGLFAGYTKNLGSMNDIYGEYFSRGSNIDYVYRFSPRIIFNSGKMRFAGEIEYTVAAYGDTQLDGTVENAKEVGNLRILIGVYYFF